jgi:hypothetical protein
VRDTRIPSESNYFDGNFDVDNDLFMESDEDEEMEEYIPPGIEEYIPQGIDSETVQEIPQGIESETVQEIQETLPQNEDNNEAQSSETSAATTSVLPEFTVIDGIKMKTAPFNKLALVNLREKGIQRLTERDIVNTQQQRKRRIARKLKYRKELRDYWDLRNESHGDANHDIFWKTNRNNLQVTDIPWWRTELTYKLDKIGRKMI